MIKISHSLKTTGADAYRRNLDKLSLAVGKAAADIDATAKKSIKMNSGQWKLYGNHWSSPPGSPPNTDTGNLANSITHSMSLGRTNGIFATVRADAKYAVPLELGWHSKQLKYVPPRPFMVPAVDHVRPKFQKAVAAILRGK